LRELSASVSTESSLQRPATDLTQSSPFDPLTTVARSSPHPILLDPAPFVGEPLGVQYTDATATEFHDPIFPPFLQLPVDALAGRADQGGQFLLGDLKLGAKIIGQRENPSRQAGMQGKKNRILDPLIGRANPIAQQFDDPDSQSGLALEMQQEFGSRQH